MANIIHGYVQPTQAAQFSISLCSPGDFESCLLSYCCLPCATAQTRTQMDGSSWWFNLCAFQNPITLRWMIRNAYNIPGSAFDDLVAGLCCPCCTINQAYQTTKELGLANQTAGPTFNTNIMLSQTGSGDKSLENAAYALCGAPCAQATVMSNAFDMPFFMGCCCMSPCTTRNLIRYHYRIQGSDCVEDCLIPGGVAFLGYSFWFFVPITALYFMNFFSRLLGETQTRSLNEQYPKQYLATPNSSVQNAPVFAYGEVVKFENQHQPVQVGISQQNIIVAGAVVVDDVSK